MNDESILRLRPRISLLEKEQMDEIHQSSLDLLEGTGVRVYSEAAVQLLTDAGCRVNEGNRVYIPFNVVEKALNSVPRKIDIYSRTRQPAMELTERNSYFGTGSDTPNVIDFETGNRRPAVIKDVERAAQLADRLENIDFIMSMGTASDVPIKHSDCWHFAGMVRNSTKPIMFTAWSVDSLKDIYDMAVAVAGDEETLQRSPFLIHYAMAIAPFVHPKDSIEKVLFCAEKHLPVEYHSVDIGGSTAPATLMGCYVQGNARMLSGVVIHQLKEPGAPIIIDTSVAFLDMKTMVSPYVAPEVMLASIMNKEMALYYGIPSFAKAGVSDAKKLDLQAAVEIGMTIFHESLIGNNLIHDSGYLESGLTSSLESMVICDEAIHFARRYARGVDFSPDHFALQVIREVGPSGNYLTHEHTLNHFREEFWFSRLFDHQNFDSWKKEGSLTLFQRAHSVAEELLKRPVPFPLEKSVVNELEGILENPRSS